MAIDLLVLSVFLQETTQDAHPPHPQLLDGHTGVGRTLALTGTGMTSLSAGRDGWNTNLKGNIFLKRTFSSVTRQYQVHLRFDLSSHHLLAKAFFLVLARE